MKLFLLFVRNQAFNLNPSLGRKEPALLKDKAVSIIEGLPKRKALTTPTHDKHPVTPRLFHPQNLTTG